MSASGYYDVTVTSASYLRFAWTEGTQSTTNNTTVVSWTLKLYTGSGGSITSSVAKSWSVTVDNTTTTGTKNITIGTNTNITIASGSTTITHDSDGTKTFSYSFSLAMNYTSSTAGYIGTKSGSSTGTLTTIPRASTVVATSMTIGTAATITIQAAATSFTHTVSYSIGSASGTIATKTSSTSLSWTPPASLANQITSSKTGTITITCVTYTGSTQLGTSTTTATLIVPNSSAYLPTISSTTLTSSTDSVTHLTSGYYAGLSTIAYSVSASAAYSATISSYLVTFNGVNYSGSSGTLAAATSAGTYAITVKVTDSRGYSASATYSVIYVDYMMPTVSTLMVSRCDASGTSDDEGSYCYISFVGTAGPKGVYDGSAVFKIRQIGSNTTTTLMSSDMESADPTQGVTFAYSGILKNSSNVSQVCDPGYSYSIIVTLTDGLVSTTKSTTLSVAFNTLDFYPGGKGVAFGKMAGAEDFEVQMPVSGRAASLHTIRTISSDLNLMTMAGTWRVTSGFTNAPTSSAGTLQVAVFGENYDVSGNAGDTGLQTYILASDPATRWERAFTGTASGVTWGNWSAGGSDALTVAYLAKAETDYGDCIVLHNSSKCVVIDFGYETSGSTLMSYLDDHDITHIDYVVISHYHGDHIGGSSSSSYGTGIRAIKTAGYIDSTTIAFLPHGTMDGYWTSSTSSYLSSLTWVQTCQDQMESIFTVVVYPVTGDSLAIGGTEITFFNSQSAYSGWSDYISCVTDSFQNDQAYSTYNNFSLCCRVEHCGHVFAFLGDLEPLGQSKNLAYLQNIDVLKVQHHGLVWCDNKEYLGYLHPKYCVVGGRYDSSYDSSKNFYSTVATCVNKGAVYLNTVHCGTITIKSSSDSLVASSDYSSPYWSSDMVNYPGMSIPPNADLDDYTDPGEYFCYAAARSATLSNTPITGSSFHLTVSRPMNDHDILRQELRAGNSSWRPVFYRTRYSSNSTVYWSSWHNCSYLEYIDIASANYTISSSNYYVSVASSSTYGLPSNSEIVSAVVVSWSSSTGAWSLVTSSNNVYLVGAGGVTVNGLKVRVWYRRT